MKKSKLGLSLLALCCATTGYCDVDLPKAEWTFKVKETKQVYATGLKKKAMAGSALLDHSFRIQDVAVPKSYDLNTVAKLSPIYDQGQCGSCVTNSVASNVMDNYILRGVTLPILSRQFIMDCGGGGGCNGSYFSRVAGDIVRLGGAPDEASYPYQARNSRCQTATTLVGKLVSYRVIDNSFKSIATAILQKYPVSVTVGADSPFMNYSGGVYNACTGQATNHEVTAEGFDCEGAVDAAGNCAFDADGKLPPGVGYYKIRNSWGTRYGEDGWIRIKATSTRGRLCNNIAEEAGIVETGLTPPDPKPPVPPTPPPVPFNWGLLKNILEAVGALAGVAALVIVLLSRRKEEAK